MADIRSKVELIDEEITKAYKEPAVDFTQPEWEKTMQAATQAFRLTIQPELAFIRRAILECLEQANYGNVHTIAKLIGQTHQLKNFLAPTTDEIIADQQNLQYALTFFMMRDLMPDARDEIMYFNDLLKACKKKRIQLAPLLEKLLPHASSQIRFGNYSVKMLFEGAL
ncbi:hypothetical protein SAMN04488505_107129 [Chitinophaga rupis]|uniref:Uncharacterized protein n=1 Tax=Chitinophaga rupis TaxID=573321 RepID=A0A1H8CJ12_9BACT|nr:hypothetical protein [Chitinophaga rupis]SEM94899.1 hypothetical protein SAMN04488505_107129 [Chitinophaga rupis]